MGPATVTQLLIILLFVVPGFVYQAARISVRGRLPIDLDLSTRVVRAIVSSGIFALAYLAVLGRHLVDAAHRRGYGFEHPRVGAIVAFAGAIAIPAAVALIRSPQWVWLVRLRARLPEITSYDPTPTAWDKVFQRADPCFVRVLTREGHWIAGYYGSSSYATSFPEAHQLYLERAYYVSGDGTIGAEVDGTSGVLVDCTALQLLQLIEARTAEPGEVS